MSVIVGTTLRPDEGPILELAAWLAARLGESLTLVHVLEAPIDELPLSGAVKGAPQATIEAVERVAAGLGLATDAGVTWRIAAGSPARTLTNLARLEQATLVIVGPTTRRLRNTSERVARESTSPVLVPADVAALLDWVRGARPMRWLVGTDLGESSGAAVAFAAKLARLGAGELVIAMVADPDLTHERLGLEGPPESLTAEAESALRAMMTKASPPTDGAVFRVIVGHGRPTVHLLEFAAREGVGAIVIGQRPQSFIQRVWKGSVSRGVLEGTPGNVISVPVPPDGMGRIVPPPRTLLVGVDLARDDLPVILHAASVAGAGATLHLVHVHDPDPRAANRDGADPRVALDSLRLGMERLSARATTQAPDVTLAHHVLSGEPAKVLRALAERLNADLAVFGARRRSGLDRLLFGSVSRAFGEVSDLPQLIVPERPR